MYMYKINDGRKFEIRMNQTEKKLVSNEYYRVSSNFDVYYLSRKSICGIY